MGRYLTRLPGWNQIPWNQEAVFFVGAVKSPFVNLVRVRLLEPATVVSASADEHV